MKVSSPSHVTQSHLENLGEGLSVGNCLHYIHGCGRIRPLRVAPFPQGLGPDLCKSGKSRHTCSPVLSALDCDVSGCFEFL